MRDPLVPDDLWEAIEPLLPPDPESFTVPEQSWPVEHPELSGVIMALAIIVLARLYVFVRRLETK
jgi:hypothetical protein